MRDLSRRLFLKSTAAAVAFLPSVHLRAAGANERIRVAVVGLKWRGGDHVDAFSKLPDASLAAICDLDQRFLDRETDKLAKQNLKTDTLTDCRKLLERKDIDAVVIATPNHWHALLTIWACQAGKDVYCEKPVCHNLWEGRQMVAAAKKYGRIVAAGTQARSDVGVAAAVEHIRSGALGKIKYIHALWYRRRDSIGKKPPWTPDFLDYDLWCGPSPKEPITRNELHYDWHWVWPTGNGDVCNLGVHLVDIARWFNDAKTLPRRVFSVGGRYAFNDAGETPNTQLTVFDYPVPIILENRNLPARTGVDQCDVFRGTRSGVIVQCENGYFSGYNTGGWTYDNNDKKLKQFVGNGGLSHQANFLAAVRSRKTEDLAAPLETGRQSSSCCLAANISIRSGGPGSPADIRKSLEGFPVAAEAFGTMEKHLGANGVDLAATPLTLGPWLAIDPTSETITAVQNGDAAALNKAIALTKDAYRAPYVVFENM
ncbi:MAG: Gfo/Idh/MocA family oxidoreductase [Tepidisphaeraceae bacterium]|jgi:predicted dehydrogenase